MFEGYRIFDKNLESISFDSKKIINTINTHSYVIAKSDFEFQEALKSSDILLPDGIGIVWAEFFLTGRRLRKIAGYDLFLFLMKEVDRKRGSVFFLGASQATLDRIKRRCSQEYPNVLVGIHSPPFKESFSDEDNTKICHLVNSFKPDVLFVGMTAPKQEKWVFQNKDKLNVRAICPIGAVFDFFSGNIKRFKSGIVNNTGLEGIVRLIAKPSRKLLVRNFYSVPKFIFQLIFEKLRNYR